MKRKYAAKVDALCEESLAAEAATWSLGNCLRAQSSSYSALTQKHSQTLSETELTLKTSVSYTAQRWTTQRKVEVARKKLSKRIQTLKSRLTQQKGNRVKLLMKRGVAAILLAKFERIMRDVLGFFGTEQPTVVIEKLDEAMTKGENLQKQADFLIVHIANLKSICSSLRAQREGSITRPEKPLKRDLLHLNVSKVRSIEHQLLSQRSRLCQFNFMAANIEATLRSFLLRLSDCSEDAELVTPQSSGTSIPQVFLLFEKAAVAAKEFAKQREAFLGTAKPAVYQLDRVHIRNLSTNETEPQDANEKVDWTLFQQKTERSVTTVRENKLQRKPANTARPQWRATKSEVQIKNAPLSERAKAGIEQTAARKDRQAEFAKELRAVDSARRELALASRKTMQEPWQSLDFRHVGSSWSFLTSTTRKSLGDTRVSDQSVSRGGLVKISLH